MSRLGKGSGRASAIVSEGPMLTSQSTPSVASASRTARRGVCCHAAGSVASAGSVAAAAHPARVLKRSTTHAGDATAAIEVADCAACTALSSRHRASAASLC